MDLKKLWQCPKCGQKFVRANQFHSCNERDIESFLVGKNEEIKALLFHIIQTIQSLGDVAIHPAKSQIGFASGRRFAFIPRIGKAHIDIGIKLDQAYEENLCFYRIGQVPDTNKHVHYVRIQIAADLNKEVQFYLSIAIALASR